MKQNRKQLISLLLALLLLVAFASCAAEEQPSSEPAEDRQIVRFEASFTGMSLGDAVRVYPIIAYGEILGKGEVDLPDDSLVPADDRYYYGRPVGFRVIEGLKGCQDGDLLSYWELGGEASDGTIYVHPGREIGETGEQAVVMLEADFYNVTHYRCPLVEDAEGNVTVPPEFMIEQENMWARQTEQHETIPMEEFLEKVRRVVAAQAGSSTAAQPASTDAENLFESLMDIGEDGAALKNSLFLARESAVMQAEGLTENNLLEERDTSRTFQKPVSVEALSAEGTAVYTFSHSMLTHVSWMFFFDSAEYDAVCQSVQEQAEATLPEEWRSNSGSLSDHHVMRWAGENGNELKVSAGEANDGQFVLLVELTPTIDPEQFAQLAELYTP